VVAEFMVRRPAQAAAPSVLCDVISVVTEFMVRRPAQAAAPSVLCAGISVVIEFMVRSSLGSFSVAT
jgi:hypothetical protein